jgi:hypothetical protein
MATELTPIKTKNNNAMVETPQKTSQDLLVIDGDHHNGKERTTSLAPLPSCDPNTDFNLFRTAVPAAKAKNSRNKPTTATSTVTVVPPVTDNAPIEDTPATVNVSQLPAARAKRPYNRKLKPATDEANSEVAPRQPPANKRRKKDQIEQQHILSDEAPPLPTTTSVPHMPSAPAPVMTPAPAPAAVPDMPSATAPVMTPAPAPAAVPDMPFAPAPAAVPDMPSAPAPAAVPVMATAPAPAAVPTPGQPGRVLHIDEQQRWIHCVVLGEETDRKQIFYPAAINLVVTPDSHYSFQFTFDDTLGRYIMTSQPTPLQVNTPIAYHDPDELKTETGAPRNVMKITNYQTNGRVVRYFKFNLNDYWCTIWGNVFMTQLNNYNRNNNNNNQQDIFSTLKFALESIRQNQITIRGTVSGPTNTWFRVTQIDNLDIILTNYINSQTLHI